MCPQRFLLTSCNVSRYYLGMRKTETASRQIRVYQTSETQLLKRLEARKKREPRSILADVIRDLLNHKKENPQQTKPAEG